LAPEPHFPRLTTGSVQVSSKRGNSITRDFRLVHCQRRRYFGRHAPFRELAAIWGTRSAPGEEHFSWPKFGISGWQVVMERAVVGLRLGDLEAAFTGAAVKRAGGGSCGKAAAVEHCRGASVSVRWCGFALWGFALAHDALHALTLLLSICSTSIWRREVPPPCQSADGRTRARWALLECDRPSRSVRRGGGSRLRRSRPDGSSVGRGATQPRAQLRSFLLRHDSLLVVLNCREIRISARRIDKIQFYRLAGLVDELDAPSSRHRWHVFGDVDVHLDPLRPAPCWKS
jgi:hypothetical protein